MGRRSFFFKDYVAHLVLIVCAFALAGVVFCYQMSSYALHAKQTELRTTVQSLAEQSKLLEGTDSDVIRQIYMLSIARVAKEDELTVLITDADGTLKWVPSRTARPTRCPAIISQLKWLRRCTKTAVMRLSGRSAC